MSDRVAILATCFNRKAKTLAALEAVMLQRLPAECGVEIFLVDDASSDGTAEAVRTRFPQVHLVRGTGDLFWNGGMRLAWAEAFRGGYDYYLWLNDDTNLEPDAIARMLDSARQLAARGRHETIIVGATRDATTGEHTYGGVVRRSRMHRLKFKPVPPGDELRPCDTMNGNCVLITRAVAERVGNLNASFTHSIGDFDYGLRAGAADCSVWVMPGFAGTCSRNSGKDPWSDRSLSARQRWRQVNSSKGLPPKEWREFARRHGGPLWPVLWLLPYLRLALACLTPESRARSPKVRTAEK